MKIDKTNRLNPLNAPWRVRPASHYMTGNFLVLDAEQSPIATTYTETDANVLSFLPELSYNLTEAMYEYCFACREAKGLPLMDSHEIIKTGCHEPNGKCFVQRWIQTLKKIQDELEKGRNAK